MERELGEAMIEQCRGRNHLSVCPLSNKPGLSSLELLVLRFGVDQDSSLLRVSRVVGGHVAGGCQG